MSFGKTAAKVGGGTIIGLIILFMIIAFVFTLNVFSFVWSGVKPLVGFAFNAIEEVSKEGNSLIESYQNYKEEQEGIGYHRYEQVKVPFDAELVQAADSQSNTINVGYNQIIKLASEDGKPTMEDGRYKGWLMSVRKDKPISNLIWIPASKLDHHGWMTLNDFQAYRMKVVNRQ